MKKSSNNAANIQAGLNLKYFMECNGISIDELAESFGVTRDAVKKILDGTNAISSRHNSILVKKYNCDLNSIYGGIACSAAFVNGEQLERVSSREKRQEIMDRDMKYLVGLVY